MPAHERRQAIVDAVIPLVLQHGEMPTSREIAQAAGVSEGTIFNVFTDKSDLIDAVVETVTDPGRFEAAIEEIDHSRAFVDQLVEAVEKLQRRVVDIWRVVTILPDTPVVAKRWAPSPALVSLMSHPAAGVKFPPESAAGMLRAVTLSLSHPMMSDEPMAPAAIVDVFLHGVSE